LAWRRKLIPNLPPVKGCNYTIRCVLTGQVLNFGVAVSAIRRTDVSCPRCKARMDEVARIAPLQKAAGLVAYECPACRYTTSEILPARGGSRED
jgi:hypothetical protein